MDELDISGRRYLSTRRAAREHGYHSDYMGQLIRSGKVAGQKVGRAWYIEEESLAAYLGKEPSAKPHSKSAVAEIPEEPQIIEKKAEVIEEAPEAIKEPEEEKAEPAFEIEILKDEEPQEIAEAAEVKEEGVEEKIAEEEEVREEAPIEIKEEETNEDMVKKEDFAEEKSTRIPIHIPAAAIRDIGGLRYVADDSPSLPAITRMPKAPLYHHEQEFISAKAAHQPHAASHRSRFPFISLSVVGVLALLTAGFASNFVSATVTTQQGKAATVEYAIHW